MNLQEFTYKMDPLLQKGKRVYTSSVLDLIYTEVKNLNLVDFERLVNHLNGSLRTVPMVPDFRKGIQELSIRPKLAVVNADYYAPRQEENLIYHLRENIWADNTHIHVRGKSVRECGFIIKADHPGNPVVQEDSNVRHLKLKECKEHLLKGTFPKFEMDVINEMRRLSFSDFNPEPA